MLHESATLDRARRSGATGPRWRSSPASTCQPLRAPGRRTTYAIRSKNGTNWSSGIGPCVSSQSLNAAPSVGAVAIHGSPTSTPKMWSLHFADLPTHAATVPDRYEFELQISRELRLRGNERHGRSHPGCLQSSGVRGV